MSKYCFLPDGIIQPSVIWCEGRGSNLTLIIKNKEKEFRYKLRDPDKGWGAIIAAIQAQMMKPFNDDIINLIASLSGKIETPQDSTSSTPLDLLVTITKGNTLQLSTPDHDSSEVTFTSSDTSIATVSNVGLCTGVGAGSCTIIASLKSNGTIQQAITLNVT